MDRGGGHGNKSSSGTLHLSPSVSYKIYIRQIMEPLSAAILKFCGSNVKNVMIF